MQRNKVQFNGKTDLIGFRKQRVVDKSQLLKGARPLFGILICRRLLYQNIPKFI